MYNKLKELIEKSSKITLVSHITPDADAIGSSLAFYLLLKRLGKNVKLYNQTKILAKKYDFLPSYNKITNNFAQNCDLVIAFDCGSFKRLGIQRGDFTLINIDHHKSNDMYGDLNIINASHASTSSLIFDIFTKWKITISKDIALCLYTALVEDTNFFTDASTNHDVFLLAATLVKHGASPKLVGENLTQRESLAKLRLDALFIDNIQLLNNAKVAIGEVDENMLKKSGALRYDTAHLADILQSLSTVILSIFVLHMDDGSLKFSLRSQVLDVSKLASLYGGGGHSSSAGFTAKLSQKNEIIKNILGEINI